MNKISLFLFIVLLPAESLCQGRWKEGLTQDLEIGINNGYLTFNMGGLDKRYSTEFRIGSNISKSLGKRFDLRLGMRFGFKPKTNYYLGPLVQPPLSYLSVIDESLSKRAHYYLEMPFVFVLNVKKFNAGAGVLARHYLKIGASDNHDYLLGNYDAGFYSAMGIKPTPEIRVGIEAYFGLTPLFSAYFLNPSTGMGTIFEAKNNFIGLSAAYRLR